MSRFATIEANMSYAHETCPRGGRANQAAQLRALLELERLVQRNPGLRPVLAAVARTVSESLGFATVAMNLYRPHHDDYEVTTVHGNEAASSVLLGRFSAAASFSPMLDSRFLCHGAFFIPAGAVAHDDAVASYTPQAKARRAGGAAAWQAEDILLVTLEGAAGRHYGIMAVDEPASGLRPAADELEVLTALAAHAGRAIETAHEVTELHRAMARNRAMIRSSPDSVIAIDRAGRVLEFNPAAARMFGLRSEDVIGQELAELISPPEQRESHRRAFRRGVEQGEWPGARIELIVQRADGQPLAVELTLTFLPPSAHGEAVVYVFIRDISERRRDEEQLTYLAYHDALTGLPNRILVEQELGLALGRARRTKRAVALMLVDLDDFKGVNDGLGHAAGDRLLNAVATRLRSVLRDSDLLGRHGGDEFVVVLADLEADAGPAAELVAGKLLDALHEPFVVAGSELRTGASIGISLYPDDALDTEALMRHADVAMYQAKAAGGGRVTFHRAPQASSSRRASLSAQLRRAVTRSELELHYQPVWRLGATPSISGVEALLRWRHPDRGLLAPKAFIGPAEQGSAGEELIDWVLSQACRQALSWHRAGLHPRLSLNVSRQQLLAPGYAQRFVEQVRRHQLSTDDFMIELTESAWTVDAAQTLTVTAELGAAGTWLAIDNFGAGYSSLSRLHELAFDVIKIDRSLLAKVPRDRTATAVFKAVVDLAQACGAAIVAHGVERDGQVGYLSAAGIDQVQGFLFGRPVTAAQITPLLQQRLIRNETAPGLPPPPPGAPDKR